MHEGRDSSNRALVVRAAACDQGVVRAVSRIVVSRKPALLPEGGQTLITTTSASALPVDPSQLLHVAPGEVRS